MGRIRGERVEEDEERDLFSARAKLLSHLESDDPADAFTAQKVRSRRLEPRDVPQKPVGQLFYPDARLPEADVSRLEPEEGLVVAQVTREPRIHQELVLAAGAAGYQEEGPPRAGTPDGDQR